MAIESKLAEVMNWDLRSGGHDSEQITAGEANEMPKTPYISIYSTDDEVATYAAYVGECTEKVREFVRRCDMKSTEFATALGTLLAVSGTIGTVLPARQEHFRQQRAEVRDMAEHRRRDAQLARRDEPSRG